MSTVTSATAWNDAKSEAQGLISQIDKQTARVKELLPRWKERLEVSLILQSYAHLYERGTEKFQRVYKQLKDQKTTLAEYSAKVDAMISTLAAKTVKLPFCQQLCANLERNKLYEALKRRQQTTLDLRSGIQHMSTQVYRRYDIEQRIKGYVRAMAKPFEGLLNVVTQAYGVLV